MRKGFTLLEAIVAMGIISVLVSVLLTGLHGARDAAHTTLCLAHLRESASAILLYSSEHSDVFPIQSLRGDVTEFMNGGMVLPAAAQSFHWPNLLAQAGEVANETWLCPESPTYRLAYREGGLAEYQSWYPKGYVMMSDFRLGFGAFTNPAYWRAQVYPPERAVYRAVRASETKYPSDKGLLIESNAYHSNGEAREMLPVAGEEWGSSVAYSVAWADGSMTRAKARDLAYGARPEPDRVARPVLHTAQGIMGRDRAAPE